MRESRFPQVFTNFTRIFSESDIIPDTWRFSFYVFLFFGQNTTRNVYYIGVPNILIQLNLLSFCSKKRRRMRLITINCKRGTEVHFCATQVSYKECTRVRSSRDFIFSRIFSTKYSILFASKIIPTKTSYYLP